MEYKDMRLFVEVVRCGGFTEAARACSVSQSAVSKAVKALESESGFSLLMRGDRPRSRLTQAGQLVYQRAVHILLEAQNLQEELDDLRGLRRGSLRLGLPRVGSGPLFADLLATYRERYPGIELELTEHGSQRLLAAISSGEVELAATIATDLEGMTSDLVDSRPLVVLLREDDPLADRPVLSLGELAEENFLLLSPDFALNEIVQNAIAKANIHPRIATRSTQADFLIDLVSAGMGVTLLPELVLENHPVAGVVAVPMAEQVDWTIRMVWRETAHLSPAARAWLDLVLGRGHAGESRPHPPHPPWGARPTAGSGPVPLANRPGMGPGAADQHQAPRTSQD
ncbi:LysR family transcriptional regulator [Propionibacterium sp.]|uniref:LysR family transcriptional regulator n=1 Tax=Propionibacterium sp. TaxID=1977903 RepID=UPI0039E98368